MRNVVDIARAYAIGTKEQFVTAMNGKLEEGGWKMTTLIQRIETMQRTREIQDNQGSGRLARITHDTAPES